MRRVGIFQQTGRRFLGVFAEQHGRGLIVRVAALAGWPTSPPYWLTSHARICLCHRLCLCRALLELGEVGGAGLGVGVKDYRVVFAFENTQALSRFLDSGWSGSGQADAAAKTKESGGAHSGAAMVEPGVWVYQITKKGLALQLTLQGTKYYKDDDLNKQ